MSKQKRINIEQLQKRCSQSTPNLMSELGGTIIGKQGDQYAFKDTGSRILSIAHLDSVQTKYHFRVIRDRLYCPVLDDRLGVYTIMDLLPSLDINMDILLTDNEESFRSTALNFEPPREYNWIVEFDRRGTDVVTYDYDWDAYLKDYFDIGIGTYSDIVDLGFLECKGLNVGVGYEDEHSLYAYFSMSSYVSQINKFTRFYRESKDIYFPHEDIGWSKFDTIPSEKYKDDLIECPDCGHWFTEDSTITVLSGWLCPFCGCVVTPQQGQAQIGNKKRKKNKKWRQYEDNYAY